MTRAMIITFAVIFAFSSQALAADKKAEVKTVLLKETNSPPDVKYSSTAPGESALLDRGFVGAPPLIPHDIAELTVTMATNDCLGCHEPAEAAEMEGAVLAPATHLADGGRIKMERYQCVICHVPQADVKPLVKNLNDAFKVAAKKKQ